MTLREEFRDLHNTPFVMPNPWDIGSARILASLGFSALATSSAACANALGRPDGAISRDEAIEHAAAIVAATPLPVSADLENGFGDAADDAAETLRRALGSGLAGCSIEDFGSGALYERAHAAERVRAAAEVNRSSASPLMLTARAENYFRGNPDLSDTIARLQDFQEAGADVLYAPGIARFEEIRSLTAAVDRPVNVILMPEGPSITEIFDAGAARISIGSWFNLAAQSALIDAAREVLDEGTHTFLPRVLGAARTVARAMSED